jgi:glutamine synthetase
MATPQDVIKMVKENDAKFVDFRFTDTRGKEQHVTVPVSAFDEDKFENGHAFDGSSIAGWKGIQASDMQLMPDPATAYIDPFFDETTIVLPATSLIRPMAVATTATRAPSPSVPKPT